MSHSPFSLANNRQTIEVEWVNPTTMMFCVRKSLIDTTDDVQRIFSLLISELQCVFGTKLINIVVGFNEVLVHFEPMSIGHLDDLHTAQKIMTSIIASSSSHDAGDQLLTPTTHHHIGMMFNEEYDLQSVADAAQCSATQLIDVFCNLTFTVMLNGFMPGFPYMSGLPQHLQLPRLPTPRLKVPKGAVAIAEAYCGIYPQSSPGGWHILGTTEHVLFDIEQSSSATLQSGDTVQFFSVDSVSQHD